MIIFQKIAEERIKKAQENGEFENLEGEGQPLKLEDDSQIPEELRMAYKILKNSGFIPPELENLKEINTIKELLANCSDESEKYRQIQKLNVLLAKMNFTQERLAALEANQEYYASVVSKTEVRK